MTAKEREKRTARVIAWALAALIVVICVAGLAKWVYNVLPDGGSAHAAPTQASKVATEPVAPVPKGLPTVPANEPGANPFTAKGVQNYRQSLYLADTMASRGNWGWWLSFMGVHNLSYKAARRVMDWHAARENEGRVFMTAAGPRGLHVINTRPKKGSYEPFRFFLQPGDRYLALAPDCPWLSRPPLPGDGIRAGCANPIGATRFETVNRGGKKVRICVPLPKPPCPPPPPHRGKSPINPYGPPHTDRNPTGYRPRNHSHTEGYQPGNLEKVEENRGVGPDHTGSPGDGGGGGTRDPGGGYTPAPEPTAPPHDEGTGNTPSNPSEGTPAVPN